MVELLTGPPSELISLGIARLELSGLHELQRESHQVLNSSQTSFAVLGIKGVDLKQVWTLTCCRRGMIASTSRSRMFSRASPAGPVKTWGMMVSSHCLACCS